MSAAKSNFKLEEGATWTKVLEWKNEDLTPIDLTGFTARMQIRKSYSTATALHTLTSSDGITLDGPTGTITLNIPAATSVGWKKGRYVYDLEVYTGDTTVRLLQGTLEVVPEATKDA